MSDTPKIKNNNEKYGCQILFCFGFYMKKTNDVLIWLLLQHIIVELLTTVHLQFLITNVGLKK